MAKTGRDKNTKNKAKHSKLMAQKKNKKKIKQFVTYFEITCNVCI